jgi:hypothetical protein
VSLAWHRDIERAHTAVQVVRIARDYLASFTPRDLARVPERCRPAQIADEGDIALWSRKLTEEYWRLRGTAADVAVVQEMWSFFLRASVHLARMRDTSTSFRH